MSNFIYKDRIQETTTTQGTGSVTLAGAKTGFRSFGSVLSNSDLVTYCIENGVEWEVGEGTYSSNTLSRDVIIASSNSNSKVNWATGDKNVFLTLSAKYNPQLNWFNVKAFGAKGDSTTDDAAAIQSAIAACDVNRGGTVYFPQGRYRISTTISASYQGTVLQGEGQSGTSTGVGQGSSRIISDNGIIAIILNSGSSPEHATLGYAIKQLHIRAATGATTGSGILVQTTERFLIEDSTCSDYVNGYGLRIHGLGGSHNAQYAELRNFSAGDCLVGLHLTGSGPNGARLWGGYFEGLGTTPRPSSIGIHIESGDTTRLYGTVIQGYETGTYVQSTARGHELHGPRYEYCNNGLRLGVNCRKFSLFGGSFSNSILTGTGSNMAIIVESGSVDALLMPTIIDGTVNHILDGGTRTVLITPDPQFYTSSILANSSSYATGDVTMTNANQYYDGVNLLLGRGTWLLNGVLQIQAGTAATRVLEARLYNGAATFSQAAFTVDGTSANGRISLPLSAIVTSTASANYKLAGQSTVAGDSIRGNSALQLTYITAVRLI